MLFRRRKKAEPPPTTEVENTISDSSGTMIQARAIESITVVGGSGSTRIRPGQPYHEVDFQSTYDDLGGAEVLGDATSEVYDHAPGWIQHFEGTPESGSLLICASPGEDPAVVEVPLWKVLRAMGRGAVDGGTRGIGFPVYGRSERRTIIGLDRDSVELAGGTWGKRGSLVRSTDQSWRWRPKESINSTVGVLQDAWRQPATKMDLGLRVGAVIPLVCDDLRITAVGSAKMLMELEQSDITEFAHLLAKRWGLSADGVRWERADDADGPNTSRFTTHRLSFGTSSGRNAVLFFARSTLSPTGTSVVQTAVDLNVCFDAIRPSPALANPAPIPEDLRLTMSELVSFLTCAWRTATSTILLAATGDPLEVPQAGAPRIEFHLRTERPWRSGDARVVRMLDMIDLSALGVPPSPPPDALAVEITTSLDLPDTEVEPLVRRALEHIAEDFGFHAG